MKDVAVAYKEVVGKSGFRLLRSGVVGKTTIGHYCISLLSNYCAQFRKAKNKMIFHDSDLA